MPARATRAPEPAELATLMAAYQAGDLSAFDALYARLAPPLRRYLLSLSRDDTWVDDLVQETFLQVHRSRRTYNASFPVQPWAFAIAHHVFLMGHRVRRRKHDFDPVPDESEDLGVTRSCEDAVAAREGIRKAMTGLSPGTRRAVWLHHVLGWSFADVARKLGIREAAAKLRASRGMSALRQTLSDHSRRHHR
jgi:RNA polymerase sigma-70 factor (ECF subfamily)